jgi:UDP-galactopyranose mutase
MKYDYLIVGAGFSGCVLAERLANVLNKKVLIVEKRNHIGGNAYDENDEHGILVHRYGPHIFHTNSKNVLDYLSQFTEWRNYEHEVAAYLNGELYPIPINMITINKLYNKNFRNEEETKQFYNSVRENRNPILNSEDIIVNQVGYDLFEKFFKYYTKKQWNHEPKELSPSVCGRIPVRTNKDNRYFSDKFQCMPRDGYTTMFKRMLANRNIEILLNTDYKLIEASTKYDKMIYTGPIDYFFDYKYGRLPYRSIQFSYEYINHEFVQKVAVINYVDESTPNLRSAEYKHITAQISKGSTISYEKFIDNGEPFYIIPTEESVELFNKYWIETGKEKDVVFCGRLAEYKYLNMDTAIENALNIFNKVILHDAKLG